VFGTASAAGALHKNPSHGFRGGNEEMSAAVPTLGFISNQPEVRLVNQGGRLEGLAWWFVGQLLSGKQTQLLIDQGQELVRSFRVPLLNGVQDACDITHADSALFRALDTTIF
jgi:hypothetical protein